MGTRIISPTTQGLVPFPVRTQITMISVGKTFSAVWLSGILRGLRQGEHSAYSIIKDQRYNDAAQILTYILENNPTSRAALSLLGYSYFYMQDFVNAANCYEQLSLLYPEYLLM
ncbi:unnamed protein product, partial [Notodromas monacha]